VGFNSKGAIDMAGLTKMPKVGEKVRYIRGSDVFDDLTVGKEYEVILLGSNRFGTYFVVTDDVKDEAYFYADGFYCFELVADPQPDVHALIANLGRRLHEVEVGLAPKEVEVVDKPAQIRAVCDKVRDLLIRKNHDYGDSFAQQYAKYGLQSALIRMDDKMRRLETLAGGEQAQVAESIEDTLMDLAGYALLALVEASE